MLQPPGAALPFLLALFAGWVNRQQRRVIGVCRRERTDHVIPLGDEHLLRVLREYVDQYYDVARAHLSLDRNTPIPRALQPSGLGEVRGRPAPGGFLRTCCRAA